MIKGGHVLLVVMTGFKRQQLKPDTKTESAFLSCSSVCEDTECALDHAKGSSQGTKLREETIRDLRYPRGCLPLIEEEENGDCNRGETKMMMRFGERRNAPF